MFILLIAVLIGALYLAIRFLFTEMAKSNILFTLRSDGQIKAIMHGERIRTHLCSIEGYLIDPYDYDIFPGYISPTNHWNLAKCWRKCREFATWAFVGTPTTKQEEGGLAEYTTTLAKVARKKLSDSSWSEQKLKVNPTPVANPAGHPVRTLVEPPELTEDFRDAIIRANSRTFLEMVFGVYWVGFPPNKVFRYRFRWPKYGEKRAERDERGVAGRLTDAFAITIRDEQVSQIYFRYPSYGIKITDAETGAGFLGKGTKLNRVQLIGELVIETMTVNPQKALFRTAGLSSAGEWITAILRETHSLFREEVRRTDYDHLIGGEGDENFVEELLARIAARINNTVDNEKQDSTRISAVHDYGQMILKISCPNLDLKDEKLRQAVEKIFTAQQGYREAVFTSKADKKRAEGLRALEAAPHLGLADGIKQIVSVQGGVEVAQAKYLGNVKVLTIGKGNSGHIVSLPPSLLENGTDPTKGAQN